MNLFPDLTSLEAITDRYFAANAEGLWLVMASFKYYEKHCQDNAAQRNQSSSMPGIAITVHSHFIDKYEKALWYMIPKNANIFTIYSRLILHEEVMIWRIN
jgi:hypothetical protein